MWSNRVLLAPIIATSLAAFALGQEDPKNAARQEAARVDFQGDPLPEDALVRIGSVRLRHGHEAKDAAFSPDGLLVASAGYDHTVRLWEAATGKEVRRFAAEEERAKPYSNARWQYCVAFSSDGKRLASGEHNKGWAANQVRVWEVATGKLLFAVPVSKGGVLSLAFSPDGRLLAAAGQDGTICLLDGATGESRLRWTAHDGPARSVVWNKAGDRLASASDDRTVRLWDAATGREAHRFVGHQAEVASVHFSPDGQSLVSGSSDKTIRLWEAATGKERAVLGRHDNAVHRVLFAPDGKTVASAGADGAIKLWDAAKGQLIRAMTGQMKEVRSLAFAPNGLAFTAALGDGRVGLWDVATGTERHPPIGHQSVVLGFIGGGDQLISFDRDDAVRRWDWKRGKLEASTHWQSMVAFHARATTVLNPAGDLIAVGSRQGPLRLLEAKTGKELGALDDNRRPIVAAAFSPDGRILASTGSPTSTPLSGTGVALWDVATRQLARRVAADVGDLQVLLFAPNGHLFLGGTAASHMWDVAKDKQLGAPLPLSFAELKSAAFTPDNRILACGDQSGNVQLWDVAIGEKVRVLSGLRGYVMVLSISPDSRLLAAGGWRGIKVWEIETGLERRSFHDFEGDAYAVAFAPDGRSLASGVGGQQILVWDIPGKAPPNDPKANVGQRAPALWKDLASADGKRVHSAIWRLAEHPAEAVAYLKTVLQPVSAANVPRLAEFIENMDNDDFAVREKASEDVQKLGEIAEPVLRKLVIDPPSLEVKQRAKILLEKLAASASPERLRKNRALEALEHMATPEAMALLQTLAGGAAEARFTREASASLNRLKMRPTAP